MPIFFREVFFIYKDLLTNNVVNIIPHNLYMSQSLGNPELRSSIGGEEGCDHR